MRTSDIVKAVELDLAGDKSHDYALSRYLKADRERHPVEHPLWVQFVSWLEQSTFIHHDILTGDWPILWRIYVSIKDGN